MDQDTPREPPAEWLEALDAADADVAAGRTVPWDEVRTRLLAIVAEPEAAQVQRQA